MGECHHRDIYDHPDGDGAECGYPLPCPHHGMRGALVWLPEEHDEDKESESHG
jgi:hypothetical protein